MIKRAEELKENESAACIHAESIAILLDTFFKCIGDP